VPIKKKKRKHGKVRLRARRAAWSVHSKRRASSQEPSTESRPARWLRMIPAGPEVFDVLIPEAK
jgi:hypothetical protein